MTYNDVRQMIRNALGSVIRFTRTTSASADGHDDAVEGRGEDDEAPKYSVRRLWPFGVRSLPPEGVDTCILHANGGSTNGIMVGAESKKYGPNDLKTGETELYCIKEGAKHKLDENGKVLARSAVDQDFDVLAMGTGNVLLESEGGNVNATAAEDVNATAGGDMALTSTGDMTLDGSTIHLNGGGRAAAGEGHAISGGTIQFVAIGTTSITSLTITYTPRGTGTPQVVTLTPSGSGTITLDEIVDEGSSTVEIDS